MQLLYLLQRAINLLLEGYQIALLVYFLLSWFPNARGTGLWNFLYNICEPFVGFFRRFIPPIGSVSFAGVLALVVLSLLSRGVNEIFFLLYGLLA